MKTITHKFTLGQLSQFQPIQLGDYHSMDNGRTICPIANEDTEGQTPIQFSKDRSFWRILPYDD